MFPNSPFPFFSLLFMLLSKTRLVTVTVHHLSVESFLHNGFVGNKSEIPPGAKVNTVNIQAMYPVASHVTVLTRQALLQQRKKVLGESWYLNSEVIPVSDVNLNVFLTSQILQMDCYRDTYPMTHEGKQSLFNLEFSALQVTRVQLTTAGTCSSALYLMPRSRYSANNLREAHHGNRQKTTQVCL